MNQRIICVGQSGTQYRIIKQIGRGGSADVYLAAVVLPQTSTTHVAIKVFRDVVQSRFEEEMETLLSLQHPNIVPILDYGENFYVMNYYIHGTVARRLDKHGPFTIEQATRVIRDAASALAYLHENGIIHRDVKPQNMLIDKGGKILLSDFGIAKHIDSSTTLTQTIRGTVYYMSPEVLEARSLTTAVDQYALGIVAFELLTGELPFIGDEEGVIIYKHLQEPAPHINNPAVSAELEQVIHKALSKDPNQRYRSITDFSIAFENPPPLALRSPFGISIAKQLIEKPFEVQKSLLDPRLWKQSTSLPYRYGFFNRTGNGAAISLDPRGITNSLETILLASLHLKEYIPKDFVLSLSLEAVSQDISVIIDFRVQGKTGYQLLAHGQTITLSHYVDDKKSVLEEIEYPQFLRMSSTLHILAESNFISLVCRTQELLKGFDRYNQGDQLIISVLANWQDDLYPKGCNFRRLDIKY